MINAKEAKWQKMFNRMDPLTQQEVQENMSKLFEAFNKMSNAIICSGNTEAVCHVSLMGDCMEKCVNRFGEICVDKGWGLKVNRLEDGRLGPSMVFDSSGLLIWELRLVLKY